MTAETILARLRQYQFFYSTEDNLQEAVERALTDASIPCEREVRFNANDRIDVLAGDIGIEVKIKGSAAAVLRQMHRYAQLERISALILVTTKHGHRMPAKMNGKPVYRLVVGGAF